MPAEERGAREAQALRKPGCALLSAVTGEGIAPLLELIEGRLGAEDNIFAVWLDPADGQGQAWLHERGEVMSRKSHEDGRMHFKVRLSDDIAGQAKARFGRNIKLLARKTKAAAV